MRKHYERILHDSESRVQRYLDIQILDENSPFCGGFPKADSLAEPKTAIYRATTMTACYLNPESRYYLDAELGRRLALALAFVRRSQRPGGYFDLINCNFFSGPDTAFCTKRLLPAYVYLCKVVDGALPAAPEAKAAAAELKPKYEAIIRDAADALCHCGFHTPNHRWAIASVLMLCAKLFDKPECRTAAEAILKEGNDCNEDGEYAERSAGNYNRINNDAMIMLAVATGDESYYAPVLRNLEMMLTSPDILLLDEPTNHLDLNSIAWLETYLLNYSGAVLIVSHDRYFLNRVVTKVIEVDQAHIRMYMGNYKAYAAKKQQIRDARLKEYMNQQREIKHQQAVIEKLRSFNREKSIKRAESREKMLDRITPVEKPVESVREMHFSLEPSCISGSDVLTVEHLSKRFDSQQLFQDISFEIHRGEHVAIIGDNGTGKTTLLKIINQVVSADEGSFTLGSKVKIGYYDQEHHVLHDEKTIFDEISDDYPSLTHTQIRNTLAAFQFTGEEVFKQIRTLSGGEKGRVSLAKLMLSEANFLILDEPTNHLDITSKEILEEALNNYSGTVLYVSHDRYFINQTCSRILELVNQTFVNYIGNYDYYLEKKEELTRAYASAPAVSAGIAPSESSSENQTESKLSWQEQKEQQAKERKRKNDLKKTEEEIAKLEERNTVIDEELTKEEIDSNSIECQKLSTERAENEEKLEALYERWEELAEEV